MKTEFSRLQLRQRAEYTQKNNLTSSRHGWLRLTPAYSAQLVQDILAHAGTNISVLDPFGGTGTTALTAAMNGQDGTTMDINPFLVWLTAVKTRKYQSVILDRTRLSALEAVSLVSNHEVVPAASPEIRNIDRWWSKDILSQLRLLKGAIEAVSTDAPHTRDLLLVAFLQVVVSTSSAAFNHQSMSFKDRSQIGLPALSECTEIFLDNVETILSSAINNPSGQITVVQGDARDLRSQFTPEFDLIVTSPPYANRMSYIRELRPYMYWLGYLSTGRDAAELDWQAIGGTWGVATSRLASWSYSGKHWVPPTLANILRDVASKDGRSSSLLANYIGRYCEDMSQHFEGLGGVIKPGGKVHYIVGNSSFYGVVVPTEQIYAAFMREYGFVDVRVTPVRKRNSKRELVEFDVSATWPG